MGELRQVIAFRDRGQVPYKHVAALLQRRASEIGARIGELRALQDHLEQLSDRARTLDPSQCDADRVCHAIA